MIKPRYTRTRLKVYLDEYNEPSIDERQPPNSSDLVQRDGRVGWNR